MNIELEILKRLLAEADEDETPEAEDTKEEKPKKGSFEEDPMGFILKKYHSLNELMEELMTPAFKEYVDGIFLMAPKPTTFKVLLHNGQYFFLTFLGAPHNETKGEEKDGVYEATIEGKRYYLAGIGEKERCMMAIARLLRFGTPLKTKGPEGAEQGTRENTGMEGDWAEKTGEMAAGGEAGGEETAAAAETPEGGEELKESLEILKRILIAEGGKSGEVRYNSEVGLLCGLLGVDASKFKPKKPELSLPANKLQNPEQVYADIKRLLVPNYDEKIFYRWAIMGKQAYKEDIENKCKELKTSIKKYGWVGGSNISETGSPVDIDFIGCKISGVSIKEEGGITLANITPKAIGLEPPKGEDVFRFLAPSEYDNAKSEIVQKVLKAAKAQPGKPLAPISSNYTITYDAKKDTYKCTGKKEFVGSEKEIMNNLKKNSPWQRVFGDWYQANYKKESSITKPLYNKAAQTIENTIKQSLGDKDKLATTMRFGKKPYFYATPKSLYYVPSKNDIEDLRLADVTYGASDGTSQKFVAKIASGNSDNQADVDIYIRYANGMFETNPTVRIQSLKNPQNIGWQNMAYES